MSPPHLHILHPSAERPEYGDILRVPEVRKASTKVDEDRNYAVFVSYVEFYNNSIYDLLDDSPHDTKSRSVSVSVYAHKFYVFQTYLCTYCMWLLCE